MDKGKWILTGVLFVVFIAASLTSYVITNKVKPLKDMKN